MADYIPVGRPILRKIATPLTLTQMQLKVGGFIKFVDLSSGDIMVINESATEFPGLHNPTASQLAGSAGPIFGDAIICSPSEIA